MPSNNITPLLHFGLAGRFAPASLLQQGDLVAGLGLTQKGFADIALKRQFLGRMSWDHTAPTASAEVQFYPHNFSIKGSATAATWQGGGDVDGSTTAIGNAQNVLGLLFVANVTRATAPPSAFTVAATLYDATDNLLRLDHLIYALPAQAVPSEAAPWWGVAMMGSNTGYACGGLLDVDGTGSDYIQLLASGVEGTKGTVDVVMIAKGS